MEDSAEGNKDCESVGCRTFEPCQLNLASALPVGSGAVSHVIHSTLQCPPYLPIAVKVVSKIQLLQQKKVQSAMNEKRALLEMGPHPFVVRLYGTSQSTDELYFVMEHLPHGDLLEHIRTRCAHYSCVSATQGSASSATEQNEASTLKNLVCCLDFHDIQLITAQLVIALARVFASGFVLRDLKPENIVFDSKYRACLVDFDTVDVESASVVPQVGKAISTNKSSNDHKKGKAPKRRVTVSSIQAMRKNTSNFCGTAQYVSPEAVGECRWSYSSDLWALGAIVYEMMYGKHMFPGDNAYMVMKSVVRGVTWENVPFPRVYLGPEADAFERVRDFIISLCQTDPTKRLGVNPVTSLFDVEALRQHPLFGDFCWDILDEHVLHYRSPFPHVDGDVGPAPAGVAPPLHPQMLSDNTASLEPHYHAVPVHSTAYAEYVYEATADANPFERWAHGVVEKPLKAQPPEDCELKQSVNSAASNENSLSSDDYSVVDDVGCYQFSNVHGDFMSDA
uniref:non-specific serine/threonine protein kinase n=1 Tax=Trypanosoma congolense (strain IL3000) TaxID=1068625 RepID=G0UNK0_TRYCI|nr:unnamed protein product [Trypanosoma congolense IL3000]